MWHTCFGAIIGKHRQAAQEERLESVRSLTQHWGSTWPNRNTHSPEADIRTPWREYLLREHILQALECIVPTLHALPSSTSHICVLRRFSATAKPCRTTYLAACTVHWKALALLKRVLRRLKLYLAACRARRQARALLRRLERGYVPIPSSRGGISRG